MADRCRRVLVVSNMYPTAEHAAGGIFVHEQVKALLGRGLDVRVVTGRPVWLSGRHPLRALRAYMRSRREPWSGWEAFDGVKVARFPYPAGAFSRPWLYPWLYADSLARWLPGLTSDFPYDLVHTHTAFLDGRAGSAAARFRGVPMVLTEHSGPLRVVTEDWRWRLHTQAGVDAADLLIAVSSALRQDMLDQLRIAQPSRLIVLPNGVDTSFFDPSRPCDVLPKVEPVRGATLADMTRVLTNLASELDHASGPLTAAHLAASLRRITATLHEPQGSARAAEDADWQAPELVHALWVGHHVGVKRVDRLLDAFAIAHRHQPRLRLTLLGSGPCEPQLRRQAKALRLDNVVRFRPAADRHGVRAAMSHAQFLVLPSQSETFGVVIIEALAMGLPVLATRCGGPQDIVNDPALGMLTENTLEDLALGLQHMAGATERFDPARIRQIAVERFDYGLLAERLVARYEDLLAENRAQDLHPQTLTAGA